MTRRPSGIDAALRVALFGAVSLSVVAWSDGLRAQTTDTLAEFVETNPDAQLLLQADELIYNNDSSTISAVGDVRIDYDGTRLVARRVTYSELTGRMTAVGNVEIVQADGTRLFADEIDVTDDFSDGFVNALRVVTTDNTRFASESGERRNGTVTIFNNGIYTACEPCRERPDKPPIWQVKAEKIIWNGEAKTVRFENASFEFLGITLARLPVFTTADPTVRRKTGFLAPGFGFSSELGASVSIPYFIVLAPDKDLRLTAHGYTRQGFLAEAEYRQQFERGLFTLKAAGIHQLSEDVFDAGTEDRLNTNRGMIATTAKFQINPRWTFGWDVLVQSDKNFARTYGIDGFDQSVRRNNIYLTGLGTRSHFNAELLKFDIQENIPDSVTRSRDQEQAALLPIVDYGYTLANPVAGGELAFDVNIQGVTRDRGDITYTTDPMTGATIVDATPGLEGNSARTTVEAEWRRTFIAPGGLAVTPIAHIRGDAHYADVTGASDTLGGLAGSYSLSGAVPADETSAFRGMVTAGLELRWPILFSSTSAVHVLEPMAQIFARPDERMAGELPNEDAQSLVFDASNLFERDKFSGYDRIEGGHRANVGIRYTGTFQNGWGVAAIAGQSFHLGGANSFAEADFTNVGEDSGLESDRSDYVASVGVTNGRGLQFNLAGRFDEDTFDVRRAGADLRYAGDRYVVAANYAFADAPTGSTEEDSHEVSAYGSLKFHDNWRLFGSVTYDITGGRIDRDSIGFEYDDECFTFQFVIDEDRSDSFVVERNFKVGITLRTIGDLGAMSSKSNIFGS